jgi:hypothetical protein
MPTAVPFRAPSATVLGALLASVGVLGMSIFTELVKD